jgi:hypothetical protein
MLSAAVVRIGVNCARFFGIYYFFNGITSIDKRLYKQDICHSDPEVQSKNINVTKTGLEFLVFYF